MIDVQVTSEMISIAALALTALGLWRQQRVAARSADRDDVRDMRTRLHETEEEARECRSRVRALEARISTLEGEKIDLMARLIRIEPK